MKKIILKFRSADLDNFKEIERGLKTVETRAATMRYQNIKPGTALEIRCGKETLFKKVKKVGYFSSIESMFRKIPLRKIMPSVKTIEEARHVYFSYHGYKEKLKKFGVVALFI